MDIPAFIVPRAYFAEPGLDYDNVMPIGAPRVTESGYYVYTTTLDRSGFLVAKFASTSTAGNMYITVGGTVVSRSGIITGGTTNYINAPVTAGAEIKIYITTGSLGNNSLGVSLIPYKASNALLKEYSTTPLKTGETWIDGKDIYRVVLTGTTPSAPSTTAKSILDLSHLNIDYVIDYFGMMKVSSGFVSIPFEFTGSIGVTVYINTITNTLNFAHQHASYNSVPFHLTLRYTTKSV